MRLTMMTTMKGATEATGLSALMIVMHCRMATTRQKVLAGLMNCSTLDLGRKVNQSYLVVWTALLS